MKELIITILFLAWAGVAQAQCVAVVKGAEIDIDRGSVKLMTQYLFNGQAVDVGGEPCDNCIYPSGRYDESQGTIAEIIELNAKDRKQHCDNLVFKKLPQEKKDQITAAQLAETKKQNKALQKEMDKLIGNEVVVTEVKQTFKQIEITVKADETIIISDKSIVTP